MGFTFKEKGFDPKIPWFYYSCRKHGVEKLFFFIKNFFYSKWFFKKKGKEKGFSKKTFKNFFRVLKGRALEFLFIFWLKKRVVIEKNIFTLEKHLLKVFLFQAFYFMAILHMRKDREQQEYMNKNARNLKTKK